MEAETALRIRGCDELRHNTPIQYLVFVSGLPLVVYRRFDRFSRIFAASVLLSLFTCLHCVRQILFGRADS